MAISSYKMRMGHTLLYVNLKGFREFFRWESDNNGGDEVYYGLHWGVDNEILKTVWCVGDEPEMSDGRAMQILPEEALEYINQHLAESKGLNDADASELERQLQRRFTVGSGQSPLAPMAAVDRCNCWRILHTRTLNVEDALRNGRSYFDCLGALERAVSVVLVEREIASELLLPSEETAQVAATLKRLSTMQADIIALYLAGYPELRTMFENAVADELSEGLSLRHIAQLFLTLSRMVDFRRSFQVFELGKTLFTFISAGTDQCETRNLVKDFLDHENAVVGGLQPKFMLPKPLVAVSSSAADAAPYSISTQTVEYQAESVISFAAVGGQICESTFSKLEVLAPMVVSSAIASAEMEVTSGFTYTCFFWELLETDATRSSIRKPDASATEPPPQWDASTQWIFSEDMAELLEIPPALSAVTASMPKLMLVTATVAGAGTQSGLFGEKLAAERSLITCQV